MGNCCNYKAKEEEDQNNEMKDGIIPKFETAGDEIDDEGKKDGEEKKDNNIKKPFYNFSQNYNQQESMDSDFINAEQKQSEDIFNFFCELRNNPQNHLSEAQKYGLQKIISTATEKAIEGDIKSLIRNSFFELYFDKCVKTSPQSKENILQSLEKEEKLKIYEKKLYMIEGDSQKPEDCVWNLLKNSENEGDILWKDIDYLLITIMVLEDKKKFLCYFLFLTKTQK